MSKLTSNVPKDDVGFPRLLESHLRCPQRLPGLSPALPDLSSALPDQSSVLQGLARAVPDFSPILPCCPKVLSGSPRCFQTNHHHSHGTPVPVIRDRSDCEGRPECSPTVWSSLEIDASKITLHILSDTPRGFQWLEYILLMSHSAPYNTSPDYALPTPSHSINLFHHSSRFLYIDTSEICIHHSNRQFQCYYCCKYNYPFCPVVIHIHTFCYTYTAW